MGRRRGRREESGRKGGTHARTHTVRGGARGEAATGPGRGGRSVLIISNHIFLPVGNFMIKCGAKGGRGGETINFVFFPFPSSLYHITSHNNAVHCIAFATQVMHNDASNNFKEKGDRGHIGVRGRREGVWGVFFFFVLD